jgi:hypothetical protein
MLEGGRFQDSRLQESVQKKINGKVNAPTNEVYNIFPA